MHENVRSGINGPEGVQPSRHFSDISLVFLRFVCFLLYVILVLSPSCICLSLSAVFQAGEVHGLHSHWFRNIPKLA